MENQSRRYSKSHQNGKEGLLQRDYKKVNWDIDLDYGHDGEKLICEIFEQDSKIDGKIEVKTERGKWQETGNIAIEIGKKQGDKIVKSGLNITKAKWWIHVLKSGDNMCFSYIFPVKTLIRKVKCMLIDGRATKAWGGDYKNSRLVLVPLKEIHKQEL